MRFRYLGWQHTEHLSKSATLLRPLVSLRNEAKQLLGLELTYFDLRASMTPEQRKKGDLQFITHFAISHAESAENTSRSEQIRYYWFRMRYLPELIHIDGQLYDKDKNPILELSEAFEMYLFRWGYLLSVPPEFVELIHGTEANYAKALAANVL
jgi:hypothetical protein